MQTLGQGHDTMLSSQNEMIWCWCKCESFLVPPAVGLLRAEETVCRAWDEAMKPF